jgi:hypothetical protein
MATVPVRRVLIDRQREHTVRFQEESWDRVVQGRTPYQLLVLYGVSIHSPRSIVYVRWLSSASCVPSTSLIGRLLGMTLDADICISTASIC